MQHLLDVLARLRDDAGKSKLKTGLLDDLRRLLTPTLLNPLQDKQVQILVHTLCANIKIERTDYINAKILSKQTHAVRLVQYAQCLLTVFNQCRLTMRFKTIKLFILHLVETLPVVRDILLAPIANIYLRILQRLLDTSIHLDHFDHDLWLEVFNFCTNSIECYEYTGKEDEDDLVKWDNSVVNNDKMRRSNTVKSEVIALFACLCRLLGWSAAQLDSLDNSRKNVLPRVVAIVSNFTRTHMQENSAHLHVVLIIRNILQFTISNHSDLSVELTQILINLAIRSWQWRSFITRAEIFDCLIQGLPIFKFLVLDPIYEDKLRQLLLQISSSLIQLNQEDNLQTANMKLKWSGQSAFDRHNNYAFEFDHSGISASRNAKNTMAFNCVRLLDAISTTLSLYARSVNASERNSYTTKKRKISAEQTIILQPTEYLFDTNDRAIILGLQILTLSPTPEIVDAGVLTRLGILLESDSSEIVSWTCMSIAIAALGRNLECDHEQHLSSQRLWDIVVKGVNSATIGDGPAYLGFALLVSNKVSSNLLAKSQGVARFLQVQGPASISVAACLFIEGLLKSFQNFNIMKGDDMIKCLALWIRVRLLQANAELTMQHINWTGILLHMLLDLSANVQDVAAGPSKGTKTIRELTATNLLLDDLPGLGDTASIPHAMFLNTDKFRVGPAVHQILTVIVRRATELSQDLVFQPDLEQTAVLIHCIMLSLTAVKIISHGLCESYDLQGVALIIERINKQLAVISMEVDTIADVICDLSLELLTVPTGIFNQLPGLCPLLEHIRHSASIDASVQHQNSSTIMIDFDEDFDLVMNRDSDAKEGSADALSPTASQVLVSVVVLLDHLHQTGSSPTRLYQLCHQSKSNSTDLLNNIWLFWEALSHSQRELYAVEILSFLAEHVLQDYRFERCQAVFDFVTKFLSASGFLWCTDADSEVFIKSSRIFEWLLKLILGARLGSAENRVGLIQLCREVMTQTPQRIERVDIGKGLISFRSLLVQSLSDEDHRVCLRAAHACMGIFDGHELAIYEHIYHDIMDEYSARPPRPRLGCFILTLLAQRDESLQPGAISGLLELGEEYRLNVLVGQFLGHIARESTLSVKSLFDRHAATLIWQWLARFTIGAFPHGLFGFNSAEEFLRKYSREISAQLLTIGHLDQFADLCGILKIDEPQMIRFSIELAEMYITTRLSQGQQFDGRRFIKQIVGTQVYTQALRRYDKVTAAFDFMNDPTEFARLLSQNTTITSPFSLQKFVTIRKFIGLTRDLPDVMPLRTTPDLFCSILKESNQKLDNQKIIRIICQLFRQIESGTERQQEIALLKLCLMLSVSSCFPLEGSLLQMSLTHLSGVLLHSTITDKEAICWLALYIMHTTPEFRILQTLLGKQLLLLCCLNLRGKQFTTKHQEVLDELLQSCDESSKEAFRIVLDDHVVCPVHMTSLVQLCCDLIQYHKDSSAQLLLQELSFFVRQRLGSSDYESPATIKLLADFVRSCDGTVNSIDAELGMRVLGMDVLMHGRSEQHAMHARTGDKIAIQSLDLKVEFVQNLVYGLRRFSSKVINQHGSTLAELHLHCSEVMRNTDIESIEGFEPFSSWLKYDLEREIQDSTLLVYPPVLYVDWLSQLTKYLLNSLNEDKFYQCIAPIFCLDPEYAEQNLAQLFRACVFGQPRERTTVDVVLLRYLHSTLELHAKISHRHIASCISILQAVRNHVLANEEIAETESFFGRVNFWSAAQAACHHKFVHETAFFLDLHSLGNDSVKQSESFRNVQIALYRVSDETDSFYGVEPTTPALQSALDSAMHEHGDGKSLPLQIAVQAASRKLGNMHDEDIQNLTSYALRDLGLDTLTLDLQDSSQQFNDVNYQSAWFLEQWNIPFTSKAPGMRQILYRTLCKLTTIDWQKHDVVNELLSSSSKAFSHARQQSNTCDLAVLASFQELRELLNATQSSRHSCQGLIQDKWSIRSVTLCRKLDFSDYEVIIASRQVFLNLARQQKSISSSILTSQLELLLSDYERCAGHRAHQALLNAVTFADKISKSPAYQCPMSVQARLKSLTAGVLWQIGDTRSSVRLSQALSLMEMSGAEVDPLISASNLLELGLRCASGRLEKPSDIAQKYLVPAVDKIAANTTIKAGQIQLRFASFCHDQLDSLDSSEDYQRLKRLRDEKLRELEELDDAIARSQSNDDQKRLLSEQKKARAFFELDNAEITVIEESRDIYLSRSIEGFLRGFTYTDDGDSLVSRCTTIWFANSNHDVANNLFSKYVGNVPSHKFLVLLNQFLARLSSAKDVFQGILSTILLQIAKDHPYHALYTMYAVQYSKRSGDETAKDRARAMSKIIQTLSAQTNNLTQMIADVRMLCSSYVTLAQIPINKKDYPTKDIPFSSVSNYRTFLKEFQKLQLPPLTLAIEPRPSCDYSDVPRIHGYEQHFRLAGGISAPKILKCRMTDGRSLRELVKGGNDDLRQDVVMQQVFAQVDDLLKRNRETAKRNLKIRTYRVLPLSTNAGVLEWVMNTIPLHELLQPLHERYRSADWDYATCRRQIVDGAKRSRTTRIAVFKSVMKHCKPVLRQGFLEMFSSVTAWYHAQLAYTRSTAAISILGHVLGLGDRHLHNILFDKKTGEVVHIDLGIAFEQGKTLPIPERVPFRLTRDVVDGMGILGTEGVFRRCCEFTLEMMRAEQASIRSILDVLKYDPLYSWTLSPLQRHRAQQKAEAGGDDAAIKKAGDGGTRVEPELGSEASRALLVVERKLSASLSASAVVHELIQEATDVENLALIFAGWAAWY